MKHRKARRRGENETLGATIGQAKTPPATTPPKSGEQESSAARTDEAPRKFVDTAPQKDAQNLAPQAAPATAEEASEIPPSLYARFESFTFLGRGGMGAVYKARDLRLGREVAVKLLFGADPALGGSLLREARSQARIAHENVCEVYEAGTVDHVRFIVMQLIHGEPLDDARKNMTLAESIRAVRQVCAALHEAHRIGLVHRDVKPSNIMVEQREDGSYRPYIMDFGLAREVGDTGATVSGAVMGTPAFMAPEQALGKVRSLDRRTDVYSLGATLYQLVAGRPPFVADHVWQILMKVGYEEAPPLGSLTSSVSPDLEAIVMKCLERDPARRYDSAKALGDDLQRFLDGDPILARKQSFSYVLWKRIKRNKGKVGFGLVMLVVALFVVGAWARARRLAVEQANLSRELGESVKEMEYFLRNANGLPLHDINRERDIVRARMREIEARMIAAGEVGLGPGHYAMGRGNLALQEPGLALVHLKQAEQAGYPSAGLDTALGMTLSELYKKALDETKRMEGEQKKKRLAEIESEYKDPALTHLKAALAGASEAPSYVEGLIAFYEGRHEDALQKAREAFEKAPWLYEAKKLEGDALFAVGSKFGHDAAFDFDAMSTWFGKAEAAYQAAAAIGSSDPEVYLAMCELLTQTMNGKHAHGDVMRPVFEQAKAACQRAIAASPGAGEGYLKLAQVHVQFVWRVATGEAKGEKPEGAFAEAIPQAEEAARRNPEDPMASYMTASLWRSRALYSSTRALDVVPAIENAIASYEQALRLDPNFVWVLNEGCASYNMRARREMRRGLDPSSSLDKGQVLCRKALDIESSFMYARFNQITSHTISAEYRLAYGKSPVEELEHANRLSELIRQQSPQSSTNCILRALLSRLLVIFRLESGADPKEALDRMDEEVSAYARISPNSPTVSDLRGISASLRARVLFEQGENPSIAVKEAVLAYNKAIEDTPWDVGNYIDKAAVETYSVRWALRETRASEKQVDVVLAQLAPFLEVERADPQLYYVVGELYELRAMVRIGQDQDAKREIAEGIGAIEKSLAINPRLAVALVCKGRLLLLRSTLSTDRIEEREAANQALEAFSAAFRANPLLERREKHGMEEAKRLAQRETQTPD